LVQSGDEIALDVQARTLNVLVSDEELARRQADWVAPVQPFVRGYTKLYQQHVTQAHEGCDFDFLQGTAATPEPVIF
jgi:dihydroxyacid dehydratase/phosphogluconate dehydratase